MTQMRPIKFVLDEQEAEVQCGISILRRSLTNVLWDI